MKHHFGVMRKPNQNLLAVSVMLAFSVTTFVHVFVFPLYGELPRGRTMRQVIDFEQSLCRTNVRAMQGPTWRHHCPRHGIVTVEQGGRLGNQMWEYAATWAVARMTSLEPYVPRCIRKQLDEVFRDLSVPSLSHVSHCPIDWSNAVHSPDLWSDTNQSIVLPKYGVFPDLVLAWAEDIRQEFRFHDNLWETSLRVLEGAGKSVNRTPATYVGVHVRRTDYREYLWRTRKIILAGADYFINAMEYFRAKYGDNVVFLIVSDDPSWCQQNLVADQGDVFVVSKNGISSPGQDLAIMAACNHSIIDYGTFGVWGAILASGETIVYNVSRHASLRVAELLPNWNVLN
ncbi:galactoside 2-alpha-L-fucosyltransferase Sec1-like [Bacillus rossius redtenbacheri]|uniref:galactoside 2-alpha-L-fucosyltransferase Sec1-like n=1 Tax=Bacillus rossius redtenbacheri TaxID=93214 RepID=UPI002FDC82C8